MQLPSAGTLSRSSPVVLQLFWMSDCRTVHIAFSRPRSSTFDFIMPGAKSVGTNGVKRKREQGKPEYKEPKTKSRKKSPSPSDDEEDVQSAILQLEAQILESRKHYNNIATLIQHTKSTDSQNEASILAAVALCRVFSRLLATGDMIKSKGMGESEGVIASWLRERYREYMGVLLEEFLPSEDPPKQSTALTLAMRLIKEESQAQSGFNLKKSSLPKLIEILLALPTDDLTREEFAEKYFNQFDDVRFLTFITIK